MPSASLKKRRSVRPGSICKAKTVRVTTATTFGLGFGTGVFMSALSLIHHRQDERAPWYLFGLAGVAFCIEAWRGWHMDGETLEHNIRHPVRFKPPSHQETPLVVQSGQNSSAISGARKPETPHGPSSPNDDGYESSFCKTTSYLSNCFLLTFADLGDDLFVYIALLAWVQNFNHSSDSVTYVHFDYTKDAIIFGIYYFLSWSVKFYGEVSPTAKEGTGYKNQVGERLVNCFPTLVQQCLYITGILLHAIREVLPLFMLIPPELAAQHIVSGWGMVLTICAIITFLVLVTLEATITHGYEGKIMRCAVGNENLVNPSIPAWYDRKFIKCAQLIGLLHFADSALPIKAFVRKTTGASVWVSRAAGLLAIPAYFGLRWGEVYDARKEAARRLGWIAPSNGSSSEDADSAPGTAESTVPGGVGYGSCV